MVDEEIEFATMFRGAKFSAKAPVAARKKAEKRGALTDKQRSRGGGRARTQQLNIRCTPAFKTLAAGLAASLNVSVSDMLVNAVADLAEKHKYTGAPDA